MAVRINGKYTTSREQQAVDDAYLRNIKIQNIKKANKENEPMWKAKQKALYPNTLDVFPSQTIEQVFYNEEYESLADYDKQRIIAKNNLIKITDSTTAEYILDRLEISKIIYLNQGFKK